MEDMRERFTATVTALLDDDPRLALVLADISAQQFGPAAARHPERVLNVGIREQLLVGVAGAWHSKGSGRSRTATRRSSSNAPSSR